MSETPQEVEFNYSARLQEVKEALSAHNRQLASENTELNAAIGEEFNILKKQLLDSEKKAMGVERDSSRVWRQHQQPYP